MSLEHIHVEGSDNDWAFIVLHGYGASMNDLAPLSQFFTQFKGHTYYPDGVLEIPMGPFYVGKAWFQIDPARLQDPNANDNLDKYFANVPDGFLEAREKITSYIDEIKKKHKNVIIGGFSQGSMMAIDLVLESPNDYKALVLLSSSLVAPERLKGFLKSKTPIKTFQSHGTGDPILPFKRAELLRDMLNNHGQSIEFHPFHGAHEIPMPIIEELNSFLGNVYAN